MEFDTLTGGIFTVVSRPRTETFDIPVQGCLYNSKLSHQVSVRFPKKATKVDLTADITVRALTSPSGITSSSDALRCVYRRMTV